MMQQDNHIFLGLKRDNHQIRQDGQFLWDAHNIRITNRDNNTLLSITNERGTSNLLKTYTGKYVGHCVIGDYLVVFTEDGEFSYIYRTTAGSLYHTVLLFKGNLGLSADHPIQTLGVSEGELLYKVYWIDDLHQPRFIIITYPELKGKYNITNNYTSLYNINHFDFVCDLNLQETVTVDKIYGSGIFSPGVIQYACTYYNRYGQESNIFYTTPLQYISFKDRAGSPEERVANSFRITITDVDSSFEYLRVYSIHRTSIDAEPTVKQLNDISLSEVTDSKVSFIDTGAEGSTVDPEMLLYVGGRDVIVGCFAQKDNTLFLGDIKLSNKDKEVIGILENNKSTITLNKDEVIHTRVVKYPKGNYYHNEDEEELNNEYSAGFKSNEVYRLGVQAQLSNGIWTSPVHITDEVLTTLLPSHNITGNDYDSTDTIKQYGASLNVPSSLASTLKGKGVKKLRACVVFPKTYERDVICQGILNPTVYNGLNRSKNTPFAQASWFFRPALKTLTSHSDSSFGDNIEFRNNYSLSIGRDSGKEIQSMTTSGTISILDNPTIDNTNFYIDENIVTLNSPDIEFDTNLSNLDLTKTKLRILGYVELSSIYGDISVETSTPPAGDSNGFTYKPIGYSGDIALLNRTNGGLVSPYCYSDVSIGKDYKPTKNSYVYRVCAFNRDGSLNNDTNRPEDKGIRTAKLSKKIISNLKVFNNLIPIKEENDYHIMNINTPQIFSNSELSILKMDIDYLKSVSLSGTYMGNVDTLLTPRKEYGIDAKTSSGTLTTISNSTKDPIRMKYKSTPHIVFRFTSDDSSHQVLLPRHISTLSPGTSTTYPKWMTTGNPVDSVTDEEHFETSNEYGGVISAMGIDFDSNEEATDYIGYTNIYAKYNGEIKLGNIKIGSSGEYELVPITSTTPKVYKIPSGMIIYNIGDVVDSSILDTIYDASEYHYYLGMDNAIMTNTNKYVYISNSGGIDKAERPSTFSDPSLNIGKNVSYSQIVFGEEGVDIKPYLLIAELVKTYDENTKFGGTSLQALMDNLWFPASDPISLDDIEEDIEEDSSVKILCKYGDTWYSRYDCLKTYPFTKEDTNQIVEIGSFMCETRVNLNGRYDKNKGQLSNLTASPQNFNLLNEVYSQKDNFFKYRVLDKEYYKNQSFPNQITWSKEKIVGGDNDVWTNITMANTLDLDNQKGKVTSIEVFNEVLLGFQERALSQIMFNSRVQIPVTDGVPIEISNGYKVDGSRLISDNIGCSNKWSITTGTTGVYFLDSNTDGLYIFNGQLGNLSKERGMDWWVRLNHTTNIWKPYGTSSNGIRTFYDNKYGDLYFAPGPKYNSLSISPIEQSDTLCYSEQLGQFTSLMSYGGTQAMFNFSDGFYSLRKSGDNIALYRNNVGDYNNFYGTIKGWDFSFISNDNPTYTKIFDTIELRADHYDLSLFGIDGEDPSPLNSCPMNYIKVDNEYQHSGIVTLNNENMRKKFRVWRGLLPRNKDTRQRIRNPWSMITLGWKPSSTDVNSENTRKAVIHDVSVKYTV